MANTMSATAAVLISGSTDGGFCMPTAYTMATLYASSTSNSVTLNFTKMQSSLQLIQRRDYIPSMPTPKVTRPVVQTVTAAIATHPNIAASVTDAPESMNSAVVGPNVVVHESP